MPPRAYFVRHAFDVTAQLATRTEHVLAAEIACPAQHDRTAKRILTGVFSHWDCMDPTWNPGGLWRPLRLRATGALRITRTRITCIEASEARGRLAVDLTIDAGTLDERAQAGFVIAVRGSDGAELATHETELVVAAGENHRRVEIMVEDPPRWWPHRLGDQPRCDVDVTLTHDGTPSDHARRRTAFREVRMRNWIVTVNDERCFLMGSNYAPTRMELGAATPHEMRRDIDLARDANLDFLRVHAHVARPELYDAADERGMLLWQDFPLQWGYARGVRRQAVRQASVMVDELAHHPSVYLWCAHNEPLAVDLEPGAPIEPSRALRVASSMALPTWNKDVLDRSVARTIRRVDPTRPVVRHSGIFPGPAEVGTDAPPLLRLVLG